MAIPTSFSRLILLTTLVLADALSSRIKVFFDSSNVLHRDTQYHPEQPARIEACVRAIDREGMEVALIDVATDQSYRYDVNAESQAFSEQELQHAREILVRIHGEEMVQRVQEKCQKSIERRIEEGKDPLGFIGYLDPDTYLTTMTFDVCLRATSAWIRAVDIAINDVAPAMALTRPPGHHANARDSNGFCVFNFAAAAATHFHERDGSKRCSILDWDVHYGQGVADILKGHERARYVSIHQNPAFPYLGTKKRIEHGNVLTIPVPAETTWTCGYESAFREALNFVAEEGVWEPDIVIICAGYDALDSDELANCSLSAKDFYQMTLLLQDHLRCITGKNIPIMLGLEGGYQLSEMAGNGNLPDAVIQTVKALSIQ